MEKIVKSEDEWKKELTPQAFQVLRKHGTERAFSGEYNDNHEQGKYYCNGCGNLLFDSKAKFLISMQEIITSEKLNKDLEETKSDPKVLLDGLEGAEDKFAKYDLPGPQETPKTHMLKKVFKDTEFNIECELSVKDFPKTAVQTLKDFFDITDEDIVNYIIPLVKPNKEKLKKSIKALM
jgi:hypothetical protein